jgi:cation transporter-like permease
MKNKLKPDSLIATLLSVGEISLVLIGLIGLAVEVFRDQGWFRQLVDKILFSPMGLLFIPVAVLFVFLLNRWMLSPDAGPESGRGNLPLYVLMAVGAYYLFKLISRGSF